MHYLGVKYPRTSHLPLSPNYADDDEQLCDLKDLIGQKIVVTEKMDGECTTLYRTHHHARSFNNRKHESRDWLSNWHAGFKDQIPEGMRICGENLYAEHAISYVNLKSYFYGFNVWDFSNTCLKWADTLEWFRKLDIVPVPILYEGKFSYEALTALASTLDTNTCEGFVVRVVDEIAYRDFNKLVAKWVRKNHVQPEKKHWFNSKVVKNTLISKEAMAS
jgi:hypothetical protein